jgi:hypothetical protein
MTSIDRAKLLQQYADALHDMWASDNPTPEAQAKVERLRVQILAAMNGWRL